MARERQVYDYLAAAKAIGYLMILLGTIIMVPLSMLLFYPEEQYQAPYFIVPGVVSILAGYLVKLFTAPYRIRSLRKHAGSVVVLLIWIVAIFIGCFPFFLSGDYTFTQSIFEATSGFTTTGFTVTDVDNATHMILLYRSMLHLVGGVGLILVLTTILSGVYGMQLFSAEGHTDRLAPSPLNTARSILLIYMGFIIGGTLCFIRFGMTPFDAFNYAISAVATGGFATESSSIGYYHSAFIDLTAVVLMILGATNFMASMYFLKGKFRGYFRHVEVEAYAFLLAIVSPIAVTQLLASKICVSIPSAIDNGVFQVVSILTTTGLSTVDNYLPRAGYALLPLVLLMMVGGHSDSTAGGIKAYRFALAFKSLRWDVMENIFPNRQIRAREISRFGKKDPVTRDMQTQNYSYILIYLLILCAGAFGLTLCGYDIKEAFVEFTSCLGTVGMSIGLVDRETGTVALWIFIVGMIIARLEVYIILLGIARIGMDAGIQVNRARLALGIVRHREFGNRAINRYTIRKFLKKKLQRKPKERSDDHEQP